MPMIAPSGAMHGFLVGQAPAAAAAGVEMDFEMIADGRAAIEQGPVLPGEGRAERRGEKLLGRAADHVVLGWQAAAFGQRVVHREISSRSRP